jgi:hypothetical protein
MRGFCGPLVRIPSLLRWMRLSILRRPLRAGLVSLLGLWSPEDCIGGLQCLSVCVVRAYTIDVVLHQETLAQFILLLLKWSFRALAIGFRVLVGHEGVLGMRASSVGVDHRAHRTYAKLPSILGYWIMRSEKHLVILSLLLSSSLIYLQWTILHRLMRWVICIICVCSLLQILWFLLSASLLL